MRYSLPREYGQDAFGVPFGLRVSRQTSEFDFTIEGWRVEGVVSDPTGALVDDALVVAQSLDPSSPYRSAAARTSLGSCSLFLPTGTYHFSVYAPSWSGFPNAAQSNVVITADTVINLAFGGVPVSGVVTGPDGAPMESVLVSPRLGQDWASAYTDPQGSYLCYVIPGSYRFYFAPSAQDAHILDRVSGTLSITGPSTLDFQLGGTRWSGFVLLAPGNAPLPDAAVEAVMFGDIFRRVARDRTDASGGFEVYLEPGREYDLKVSSVVAAGQAIQGQPASADTVFQFVLEPAPSPTP